MKYGYCRISTPKQSLARQIENINKSHPDAKIYQEVLLEPFPIEKNGIN